MPDVFVLRKRALSHDLPNYRTGPPDHLSSCNACGFGTRPHPASCARVFSVMSGLGADARLTLNTFFR